MDAPQYSILMAVYIKDNPEWFDFAIKSMLQQTIKADEFVIVKDGPITEGLEKVLEKNIAENPDLFHIVALNQNSGLGEALRVGVLECRNEWIVRMDSDDYSIPERCEIQFRYQKEHRADIVGSDTNEFVGSPDNVVATKVFAERNEDIVKFSRRRTPFSHPSVLMKKNKVIEAGNYQPAYLHEDYDLFIRMLRNGCIGYNVKESLVSVRVSEDFYERRGGLKYLKVLLAFNVKLYKSKWMHLSDFVVRSCGNIVSCLAPNCIRDLLYKKLLRK